MELKNIFATDLAGNVIPGAVGRLYDVGTTTLAGGLQDKDGNPQGNPIQANQIGQFEFAAPDGRYDFYVSSAIRNYTIRIEFFDAYNTQILEDLAGPGGSAMIGGDGETVAQALAKAKALPDYAALRAYAGNASTVQVVDDFRSGRFRKLSTTPAGYTDDGGITIIGANGWVWRRINVGVAHVDWFLAPNWIEGVTDDKVAFERASQFMRTRGGGTVRYFRRHLLDSATYVNDMVNLVGPITSAGELLNGVKDYNQRQGVLILNPTGGLFMESSAGIRGGILLRKGLTLPFADEAAAIAGVASFAGIAVKSLAPDSHFSDCLVLGFDKAYYSTGQERARIYNVMGDCTNGIHLDAVYDVADVTNTQFWPFLTAHRGFSSEVSKRAGTAHLTSNSDDWGRYTNCFSYGYNRGFVADSANNISWNNCAADWAGELTNTTSIGFEVTGTSKNAVMNICKAASQWRGVSMNSTAADRAVLQIIGGQFWNNDNTDIRVIQGSATITEATLRSTPTGIYVETTSAGAIISDNRFEAQTIRPIDGDMRQVTGGNNTFVGTVDTVMGERKFTTGGSLSDRVDSVYGASSNNLFRRSAGTVIAPTAVGDGAAVFSLQAQAHNGTGFAVIAGIRAQTRAAQTTSSAAGGLIFSTCPAGSVSSADRWIMDSDGSFRPLTDATQNLGSASARLNNSFFAVAPTVGSDARYKTEPTRIDDAALDAWANVQYSQYKLLHAVESKGEDKARLHVGLIAQEVVSAFDSQGLDASAYGLLCHDSWASEAASEAVFGEDGTIISPAVQATEASERYGIRYEEALAMEAALMRRTTARLEARIAKIESMSKIDEGE